MSDQMLEVSLLGVGMNGAPSRKECVVYDGQMMGASNKMSTPLPPPPRLGMYKYCRGRYWYWWC